MASFKAPPAPRMRTIPLPSATLPVWRTTDHVHGHAGMSQADYGLQIETRLGQATDDNALSLFVEPQAQGIYHSPMPTLASPISHGGQNFHPAQEVYPSFLESPNNSRGDAHASRLHERNTHYDGAFAITVDDIQEAGSSASDLAYYALHEIFPFTNRQHHSSLSWEEAIGLVRRIVLLTFNNLCKRHPRTRTSDALDALVLVMEQVDSELTSGLVGTAWQIFLERHRDGCRRSLQFLSLDVDTDLTYRDLIMAVTISSALCL